MKEQTRASRAATNHFPRYLWLGFAVAAFVAPPSVAADDVVFAEQVAPIFEQHCVRCHSPGNEQGEVSLATIEDLTENGYIAAGDPDSSYLLELITPADGHPPVMPKEGEPLSETELALIRRWIAGGALWPEDVVIRQRSAADKTWWSLQPLVSAEPPSPANASEDWDDHPIDRFVFAELAEHGLQPNPPADRRTLIRRATYDLTGLPPTPEEVAAFVSDPDPGAYEQLIDRLLMSPRYGERWGRHWLDVVRFGESNGYERNVIIDNLWPFRDYIIRSLNEDKPFDQLIREHLAGDIRGTDDPEAVLGSAFLVAGPYDDVGNQDPAQAAQIRANTLDEIIGATSEAFLGMTVGCARCHDHKFDPITQRDYYALYATFAGVRHGAAPLATPGARSKRDEKLQPLEQRKAALEEELQELRAGVLARATERLADYQAVWLRPPVDRTGTEERFEPVVAQFIRLVCEAQDTNPGVGHGFRIDEFEVWSDEPEPRNVALAANGGKASGAARRIEDFPDAYGPHHAIDGRSGARFFAAGTDLTIQLAQPTQINRVVFSSARGEQNPEHPLFVFVADYRIEVSDDGIAWREVAHGRDRKPVGTGGKASQADPMPQHLEHRLLQLATTAEEKSERTRLEQELAAVNGEIAAVPALPLVWIGTRSAEDAKGPFHVFLGGNPQKFGEPAVPASPSALDGVTPGYALSADEDEAARRLKLAEWITHRDNPLTPRVLANRLWHYHFGTGIVDTPNDFGYMGGRPSHPKLLDFLALKLKDHGWRLKPMHRLIMTSQTYRQASTFRSRAAAIDGEARLLWRLPPRRLSAEEIRDTILAVSGKLASTMGGPGFRLYHFMQDNVCTYVPLDKHGPETYRRAVYHQNARASIVDLMTDFDQPDCAFSAPRRAETTTPLQALTMLNHSFTLDMAAFLAERLQREADAGQTEQIRRAYQLCYSRTPSDKEVELCSELVNDHGMAALCRILLNTSEMIYVQ